ncbi:hypothetical protein BJ138DRAFT_583969 [Hygrophoropsis aurantiaca]|uniref:Uncharacterized protein n=1 Tax=Hygrophoropsis aurantiaca TaxID=72124 RepID=A0ACB8AKU1_9AGAM|nr:hypothetical protein BJ138DRAFT_583969 [Hygrophoropsis aurantiaca]
MNGNSPNYFLESMPASATPTIDVSFERPTLDIPAPPTPPLWPHRLSASFSAMADQIAAASQALAQVPATAFMGSEPSPELSSLKSRLEAIEKSQERLSAEFDALKMQFTELNTERGPGIEDLEKKIADLAEVVRIDQERLPARLHNARCTTLKMVLKAPVGNNGKPPPNFPTFRGEFEHITKERYEAIMKAYGLPIKGDTDAKRETVRAFVGIPQDGQ